MPIISVTDNENNRWKRNAKKQNKTKKQQKTKTTTGISKGEGSYSDIVKGWELNDFVVRIS